MRLPVLLPTRPGSLRLLVLAVSDRCDQRCLHCQIWQGPRDPRRPSLRLDERLALLDEAVRLGVAEVLLTGGEPLLSPELWPLAERLAAAGVRALLATNGLLLSAHAGEVARLFAEVYVSLDGGPATHDVLRGVPSFGRLRAGVAALRALSPRPLLVARCTLSARNLHELAGVVAAARELGFDHVSFLPIDTTSSAFGGRPEARAELCPDPAQLGGLLRAIARLESAGGFDDGFVLESAAKLRRLAERLRRAAGAGSRAPDCDAPWWSSVVETDGSLRPCFFHAPLADARAGLAAARGSRAYREALASVRAGNPVCDGCVCPKRRGLPLLERLLA